MTAADRARATAARFSSAPADEQAPAAAEPERPRPRTTRTDRVRSTLDLSPTRHRALRRWCDEAADELGEAVVNKQDVLEQLVALLLTDETTRRKILAALRADR